MSLGGSKVPAIGIASEHRKLLPHRFREHRRQEERAIEIPPPHASRLGDQAMGPFQPVFPDRGEPI